MALLASAGVWTAAAVLGAVSMAVVQLINEEQPDAYMVYRPIDVAYM